MMSPGLVTSSVGAVPGCWHNVKANDEREVTMANYTPDPNAAQRLGFRTPGDQAVYLCQKLGFSEQEIGQMLVAAASDGPDTPWVLAYRMCSSQAGEVMEGAASFVPWGARKHYKAAISDGDWDLAATILESKLGSSAFVVSKNINGVYASTEEAMLKIMISEV